MAVCFFWREDHPASRRGDLRRMGEHRVDTPVSQQGILVFGGVLLSISLSLNAVLLLWIQLEPVVR